MEYKYLNQINFPDDLRKFDLKELDFIAKELRNKTIKTVSKTGWFDQLGWWKHTWCHLAIRSKYF